MAGAAISNPTYAAGEGKCVGANACKGQSACKGGNHACKGLNACKGQGFSALTKEEMRRRQGQVRARLIRLPSGTGPGVGRAPFP